MVRASVVFSVLISAITLCAPKDKATVIENIRNLSEMATVEYTVTKVIKYDDSALFGSRKILFESEAVLKAGIDFNQVRVDQIKGRSIEITVPRARLISLNMAPEMIVEKYSSVGLLRSSFNAGEKEKILAQGELGIRKGLKKLGILKQAQKNSKALIKSWLHLAGFKTVKVMVEGEKAGKKKKKANKK